MSSQTGIELEGIVFHLVPVEYYEAQPVDLDYMPEPMAAGQEEFIHCTIGAGKVVEVGNLFYRGDNRPYYALEIDTTRLKSPVKFEDPGKLFPHIYDPLNREAILEIWYVKRDPEGTFLSVGKSL